MNQLNRILFVPFVLLACGSPPPAESPSQGTPAADESSDVPGDTGNDSEPTGAASDENQFQLSDSTTAGEAHGEKPSQLKPTATEAVLKFFVVDKKEGPVKGVVITLTSPNGGKFYAEETDSVGYAEVLVPVGAKYSLTYLSLGRSDIKASVPVNDDPMQNIKLTLRYEDKRPKKVHDDGTPQGFILGGVTFDTGKATIKAESYPRLDSVVEFMSHKKSARVQISGHTDNVGNPANNKKLSEKRAQACRQYLIDKGIDGSRIEAVGYGDELPVASNDTDEGRARNRRIEAREL